MSSETSRVRVEAYGAAKTVTGSCFVVTYFAHGVKHSFAIDSGLFQGRIERKHGDMNRNITHLAHELDFVALTHAHIDHSGRLPFLVKNGFKGKIYATAPVTALCRFLLADSAHIQENEIMRLNRKLKTKLGNGYEVEPLYNGEDVADTMNYFFTVKRNKIIQVNKFVKLRFTNAGHAIGSCCIECFITTDEGELTLLFSGDLGENNALLKRRIPFEYHPDYVFMETTYGGRFHKPVRESISELLVTIATTIKCGGNVIIPAFSAGRTQEVLYEIYIYMTTHDDWIANTLNAVGIYINSFLSVSLTNEVYSKFLDEFKPSIAASLKVKGDNPFNFSNLHFVSTYEEAQDLLAKKEPYIAISAAGMCHAGRVLSHLEKELERTESTVIITGFQAEGTLGRMLVDGASKVTINGKSYQVKAKIVTINAFSSHCDQNGLIKWHDNCTTRHTLFLVHGEEQQQLAMQTRLKLERPSQEVAPLEPDMVYVLGKNGYTKQKGFYPNYNMINLPKKALDSSCDVLEQIYEAVQEALGTDDENAIWALALKLKAKVDQEASRFSRRNQSKKRKVPYYHHRLIKY